MSRLIAPSLLSADFGNLQRDIELVRLGDAGEIVFGAAPIPAAVIVPELLCQLRQQNPGLVTRVHLGNLPTLLAQLDAQQIDFCLGDPRLVIFSILVVACWQYTGYVMVIVLAGMQSVSQELYEAAALDGATEVRKFISVTLPSIRNVIIAVILITMIGAIKVFDLVYTLTRGGPANASQVMSTYIYYNAFTVNRAGYASALSVVLLIIALILGVLQLRLSSRPREGA